jgi:poly(ADP-ribose) glycohydrolase ARH3
MKNRFRGCLVGLALGDALGADFEGMPPGEYIFNCNMPLYYTDDTEMMINLVESILEVEGVLPDNIAKHFIEGLNPRRGYGYGTLRVLSLIKSGIPIEKATVMVFKEGSKGNGAAMRVAPIGLIYWYDDNKIVHGAYRSSIVTHSNPIAIDGAVSIALSTGMILRGEDIQKIPEGIMKHMNTDTMREKIRDVARLLQRDHCDREEVINVLGNGVLTEQSVPTALYVFLKYGSDFIDAMNYSISLGGDTDTISAMTGALCGALLSYEALPSECVRGLENAERILNNADRLYDLSKKLVEIL